MLASPKKVKKNVTFGGTGTHLAPLLCALKKWGLDTMQDDEVIKNITPHQMVSINNILTLLEKQDFLLNMSETLFLIKYPATFLSITNLLIDNAVPLGHEVLELLMDSEIYTQRMILILNQLSIANIQIDKTLKVNLKNAAHVFDHLIQVKFITGENKKNLVTLVNKLQYLPAIASALKELYNDNRPLAQQDFDFLIQHAEHARRIGPILAMLRRVGLSTPDNREAIASAKEGNWLTPFESLKDEKEFLSQEIFTLLIQNMQYVSRLQNILQELQRSGITFAALPKRTKKKFSEKVSDPRFEFIELWVGKTVGSVSTFSLTKNNFIFMIDHYEYAKELIEVFRILTLHDIYNIEALHDLLEKNLSNLKQIILVFRRFQIDDLTFEKSKEILTLSEKNESCEANTEHPVTKARALSQALSNKRNNDHLANDNNPKHLKMSLERK